MPRRSLSMRHRIFSSHGRRDPKQVQSAPENIHIQIEPPSTPPPKITSPYMMPSAEVTSSVLRTRPTNGGRARKSIERLSGRWDRSATRLPLWESICDEMFGPNQRLELSLDFETELRSAPIFPLHPRMSSYRNSRLSSTPSSALGSPKSRKSTKSTTSSGRKILRNIPTVKGGFWNMCIRSVPKIRFVRKFEDSESLAGVGAK